MRQVINDQFCTQNSFFLNDDTVTMIVEPVQSSGGFLSQTQTLIQRGWIQLDLMLKLMYCEFLLGGVGVSVPATFETKLTSMGSGHVTNEKRPFSLVSAAISGRTWTQLNPANM